ncbi:MAG: hypothetical protein OXC14_12810 [Rhodospirillaceae bacterium]|nr:hypothetical protein [Rhodospirillaceae bacterium]
MPDFGMRERHRQATFRNESPTISVEGRSPNDDKGRRHGHLLALDYEEENLCPVLRGEEGASRFLRDRGIKWWSSSRSGDRSGGTRPTRNLASSQVACINFMLPLAGEPDALAAALSAIDDDVDGNACIKNPATGTNSLVEIEWIGLDHALEGPQHKTRGANTTSIDAFLVAETASGRRAYLIEWKYVEDYRTRYLGDGSRGATRLRRYTDAYAASPFFPDSTPVTAWFYEPFYQSMRQRLLADRMVRKGEHDVRDAKVVVVVPECNRAYRERITSPALAKEFAHARTVAEVMQVATTSPGAGFACVSPGMLAEAVRRRCGTGVAEWSEYLSARYGW